MDGKVDKTRQRGRERAKRNISTLCSGVKIVKSRAPRKNNQKTQKNNKKELTKKNRECII